MGPQLNATRSADTKRSRVRWRLHVCTDGSATGRQGLRKLDSLCFVRKPWVAVRARPGAEHLRFSSDSWYVVPAGSAARQPMRPIDPRLGSFGRIHMIYLVGGAPRTGKTILAQQVAARLRVGWVATDVLRSLLKDEEAAGWDASPEAISATAEWFFPHLKRFIWGISSLADDYLIEGVHLLPKQAAALSSQHQVRSVFLGRSRLNLAQFDEFPGRSRGYGSLPLEIRQQIVQDVPQWSEFVAREARAFKFRYVDTSDDFVSRVKEAEVFLTTK
jgi:hypothetical protein